MLTRDKNLDKIVLDYLGDKDLVSYFLTNKKGYEISKDEMFWKNRLNRFKPDLTILDKFEESWKDIYIEFSKSGVRSYSGMDVVDINVVGFTLKLFIKLGFVIVSKYMLEKFPQLWEYKELIIEIANKNNNTKTLMYLESHK